MKKAVSFGTAFFMKIRNRNRKYDYRAASARFFSAIFFNASS